MKLPHFAVNRPVTVIMGVCIILVLGFVSLSRLPLDMLPDIEVPVIAVMTNYSNAGPHEVENLVSRPIEESLGGINNIRSVSSVSRRGSSQVIAEFEWGVDMDFAALDVRERIDLVRDMLPDDADSPMIFKFDPGATPVMQLVLGGDRTPYELRRQAESLKSELERLDGVASVEVSGGQEREIQVVLHPGLLQSAGVSVDAIANGLRGANLNLPGGSIEESGTEFVLRTTGEFTDVSQINSVRVANGSGQMVRLGDIADVHDGFRERTEISRFNGNPSVLLSVQKEAAANTVQVADRVSRQVEHINARLAAENMSLSVSMDMADYILVAVNYVTSNALLGGALAMIVLFLFLRSFRTTLIIAAAIPISVVGTFVLMYFSDTSLNMVSLGGLALGVGMLVDNGIVVLENIYRRRTEGEDSETAAKEGARQVGTAITASTLTTVSVFLPVVFVAGLAAEIFRDMALTVTFSLAASLVISLSLIPMLASRLLISDAAAAGDRWRWLNFVNRGVEVLQERYAAAIDGVLRRRWVTLGVVVLVLVGSLALVPSVGTEFLPSSDEGMIRVNVQMPRGTPLADTNRVVEELERLAAGIPEVQSVDVTVGSGGTESGRLGVQLVDLDQRQRSTQDVVIELREVVESVPGANITVRASGAMMMGTGAGSPVEVRLRGDDMDLLQETANRLLDRIAEIPGIQEPRTSFTEGQPEIRLQIDRDRASDYGVSVSQVASTVRTAVSGTTVTQYRTGGEEIGVLVQLGEYWRQNPTDVENIPISTPRGFIPLKELGSLERGEGPVSISRSERSRVVSVSAQVAGRDLGSVTRDVQRAVDDFAVPFGVQVGFGGEDEQMQESFGQLSLALLLGVVLVYMVLASQFESLLQPLAIMITLPFAVIGVIGGLLAFGVNLSLVSFIGAIMLAGIVVNNAIVLVDYVNQMRSEGMSRHDALVEAGRVRLRPILMTTLTTVLAMVPLAFSQGDGSEMQQPIAVVVMGGLITSTLLTLFVLPVFYSLLDGLGARVMRLLGQAPKEVPADEGA